jgi:hypothetical protein
MRNGMPGRIPGDKSFQNPEYSEGFFRDGGLVPGSSFNPNYKKNVSKKADNFYETLDLNKKTLNPDKLWSNKVKKEVFEFDDNYVKNLNHWDSTVLKEVTLHHPVDNKNDKKPPPVKMNPKTIKK